MEISGEERNKQKITKSKSKKMETKKFDSNYILLKEMYDDSYFPKKCVDKVAEQIKKVIVYIEKGGHSEDEIQTKLDKMTIEINNLMEYFEENDSEIETVARDSIGETVSYILHYFNINIDDEEAIREREW